MAVAELSPSYTETRFLSSQLSSFSTRLNNHRRNSLPSLRRGHNTKVLCSVAPNQVHTPVAPQANGTKNKPECFGVFCLTYDLKAGI
ncbi:hypothetical protein HHK36_018132 [Tetracentron sinense]|uniref:Uncharacterized protein n=1 Tax=Tetracentron sinense TaxID=13715 RepID=A0A834YVE1_TETSI|nr:hypothetical protein HHK36_018132 [Tetracentron sinense]